MNAGHPIPPPPQLSEMTHPSIIPWKGSIHSLSTIDYPSFESMVSIPCEDIIHHIQMEITTCLPLAKILHQGIEQSVLEAIRIPRSLLVKIDLPKVLVHPTSTIGFPIASKPSSNRVQMKQVVVPL